MRNGPAYVRRAVSIAAANDTPSNSDPPLDQQDVARGAEADERCADSHRVPSAARAARPVAARSGAERLFEAAAALNAALTDWDAA